jgi:hypothetical protein
MHELSPVHKLRMAMNENDNYSPTAIAVLGLRLYRGLHNGRRLCLRATGGATHYLGD